ncbi:MAG: transposase [Sphingobacteriaceae bacterium]|nr:transposase [Sphingobacteriaceae bacterium]
MTAIPELLNALLIEGNIITIDAMGTQTNIATKIIENGADYILAEKENQEQLLEKLKMNSGFQNKLLKQVLILTLGMEELKPENAVLSLNSNLLTILTINGIN